MGVKSTHIITRKVATQIIMQKIFECSDSQLADTLESIVDSPFHNFSIVDEEDFEENKNRYEEWDGDRYFSGLPYIESANQL